MKMTLNNSTLAPMRSLSCESRFLLCRDPFRAAAFEATVTTAVLNSVLALTAVLGNGLVFAAYYKSESLRRPVFTILMAVALTDFATGAVTQPLFIYVLLKTLSSCPNYVCFVDMLASGLMVFLLGATVLNLSVTTLDRYIATFHSFQYEELVTNSRVVKVVVTLWVLWVMVLVVIRRIMGLHVKYFIAVIIIANILFICVSYFLILKEIRKLEKNLIVSLNEAAAVKQSRERKSAVTIAYIVGLLFICFFPKVLIGLFVSFPRGLEEQVRVRKLFMATTTLALSNSSLNVFVYCWKNAEMKVAMLKVIRAIIQKFRNEVAP